MELEIPVTDQKPMPALNQAFRELVEWATDKGLNIEKAYQIEWVEMGKWLRIVWFWAGERLSPAERRAIKDVFGPLEKRGAPPSVSFVEDSLAMNVLPCGVRVGCWVGGLVKCEQVGTRKVEKTIEEIQYRPGGIVEVDEPIWECDPVMGEL